MKRCAGDGDVKEESDNTVSAVVKATIPRKKGILALN
jgi:hypothetical protein